jgi:hypothetical protein
MQQKTTELNKRNTQQVCMQQHAHTGVLQYKNKHRNHTTSAALLLLLLLLRLYAAGLSHATHADRMTQ